MQGPYNQNADYNISIIDMRVQIGWESVFYFFLFFQ